MQIINVKICGYIVLITEDIKDSNINMSLPYEAHLWLDNKIVKKNHLPILSEYVVGSEIPDDIYNRILIDPNSFDIPHVAAVREISSIVIDDDDTMVVIKNKVFDIMKKYNIKQGIDNYDMDGKHTSTSCNSIEWILCMEEFKKLVEFKIVMYSLKGYGE